MKIYRTANIITVANCLVTTFLRVCAPTLTKSALTILGKRAVFSIFRLKFSSNGKKSKFVELLDGNAID